MSIRSRLARLEKTWRPKKSAQQTKACPRCGTPPRGSPPRLTMHNRYTLVTGETVTLPPKPESPPCTCGRLAKKKWDGAIQISAIIINYPNKVATREEAERDYAEYAAKHRPWSEQNEH
jgi:hypothetical protein